MKLPIIQSLWIGDPLSKIERLCIQSFLDNGHEFHLYVYDDIGNIPDGVTVKDANEILPATFIFRNDVGSFAGFSNWFRYEMLAKCGGMWTDMDMICLKPFAFGDEFIISGTADGIGTSVLGGRHEVWHELSRACRQYPKIQAWDGTKTRKRKIIRRLQFGGREGAKFGHVGGPYTLTEVVRYFDLTKFAKPLIYFSALSLSQWKSVFDETFADGIDFGEQNFSLHLRNELLRRNGYDKNADFLHGSLIEQLKRKHNI